MGFFIQSSYGKVGNFEVVVPRLGGGLDAWWFDNDKPALGWHGPKIAFGGTNDVGGVSLIQYRIGSPGNFEAVLREGNQLIHSWRSKANGKWQNRAGLPGLGAATGSPGFVQNSAGPVNLEVVAPLGSGGLGHWYRDHLSAGYPWRGPVKFGTGAYHAVALLQGSYGNLEVVARTGSQLVHWWRDDDGKWFGPKAIAMGVAGEPGFIQGTSGAIGNFEVVTPLAGGGMGHWYRNNNAPGDPWHGPTASFGAGSMLAASLIQSKAGQLHVVARLSDHLEHWSRNGSTWQKVASFGADPYTDPSVYGTSTIPYRTELVGIHAALLHTGKVVLFGYGDTDFTHGESRVLDPTTGQQVEPPDSHHLFCSGHAFLPDGKLVVAGGHHHDLKAIHTFDPASGKWTHHADMPNGRWYPTCVTLPDGQILTISGTTKGGPIDPDNPVNNTLQFLMAGAQKSEPLPSPFSKHFPSHLPTIDLYPFVYPLPSGQVFVHARHVTRFYDPVTHKWDPIELTMNRSISRTYPGTGSSVLLPLLPEDGYGARILIAGGGGANPGPLSSITPATNTVELLDVSGPRPWKWQSVAPMSYARVMPDATLLPDGTVLVNGGSATGRADVGTDPVLPYELFDPVSRTWTTFRTAHVPRLYHSTALLLPDASVLMLGKDGVFNVDPYKYPERRAEIFKPPYLFRGPRPVISSAPTQVGYGGTFTVSTPDANEFTAARLVRPAAVTHSVNMGQRLVGLVVIGRAGTSLTLKAPPNAKIAPPGYYMLFLLNAQGVPSVARFLKLT